MPQRTGASDIIVANKPRGAFIVTGTNGPIINMRAHESDQGNFIEIVDNNGSIRFVLTSTGNPVIQSPNGTMYKLVVANDGTLSTVVW